MKYVSKPLMVEAQLFDSLQSAMDWLEPGEFSVIEKAQIWLIDSHKEQFGVPLDGQWYVIRTEENGLTPMAKGEFEDMFLGLDQVALVDFSAEGNEDDGYVVCCSDCGPVGHCAGRDDIAVIAEEHMMEHHANHFIEGETA